MHDVFEQNLGLEAAVRLECFEADGVSNAGLPMETDGGLHSWSQHNNQPGDCSVNQQTFFGGQLILASLGHRTGHSTGVLTTPHIARCSDLRKV